jgi:hypothetical protein
MQRACLVHVAVVLAGVLLLGPLREPGRADYTYAWTEYALEWLVDASGAIATGRVLECSEKGVFSARLDAGGFLKKAKDFNIGDHELVKGPCLGRATSRKSELLLPVYSEPSTYPSAIHSVRGFQVDRVWEWGPGDRYLFFFGRDTKQILQIVNLDRMESYDSFEMLVVDMRGKLIIDPNDLVARIKQRVAEGRKTTPDRSVRICTVGFEIGSPSKEFDGTSSYYYLFAPPDVWHPENVRDEFTKYWYYSGKSEADFRADWRKDFARMVREVRRQWTKRKKQLRYQYSNHRNEPGGWACLISDNGRYLAYVDANYLYIYDIRDEDPGRAKLVYRNDAVDVSFVKCCPGRSQIKFLSDQDVFVYEMSTWEPQALTVRLRDGKARIVPQRRD